MSSYNDQSTFIMGIFETNRYPKFYEILECDVDCTQSTIREQYRILSLRHHPDRGGSTSKMSKLNEAYDVLSDPTKRQIYNTLGSDFIIEKVETYLKYQRVFLDYFPLFSTLYLVSLFNIKDIELHYSSGNPFGKIDKRLGYLHILGFPLAHFFFEKSVYKLLSAKKGFYDKDGNSEKQGISKYISGINILAEAAATIISAPFEIAAHNAYDANFKIKHLSDFFTFSAKRSHDATRITNLKNFTPLEMTKHQSVLGKLFLNIKFYFRSYKLSYNDIFYFVAQRLGIIVLTDFLTYLSEYCENQFLITDEQYRHNIHYRDIIIEAFRKQRKEYEISIQPYSKNNNNDNDNDNDNSNNNNNYINNNSDDEDYHLDEVEYQKDLGSVVAKRNTYKVLSWTLYFASYCVPGIIFSARMALSKDKEPVSIGNLFIASIAYSAPSFLYDQTYKNLFKFTQKSNSLIKDFIDVLYKSTKKN
ncbi:hypothetical protein RB653_003531 [Dictyostelium firmibasis]|uniref:J domain-containing protein n=1 Tax=Dictyostelium firmibasis TaxID=79012 RepID=A0AAN7U4S2_9MYCE